MHAVLRAGSTLPLGGVAGDITADLVLGLDSWSCWPAASA